MESRQGQQEPNKALKKGIADARRRGQGAKRTQGLVVAASLAATMMGWAFFVHEDTQSISTAQQDAPTVAVALAQQSTSEADASISSATPQVTTSIVNPTVQATPIATTITTTVANT